MVDPGGTLDQGLHAGLVRALKRHPAVGSVEIGDLAKARATSCDYRLEFDVDLEGEGEGLNLLRCFPGFLIGVPSWAPLAWECTLTTQVDATAAEGGWVRRPPLRRVDGVDMSYTSEGYATAAYSGWWALAFTPSLTMPLVTGIVASFDTVPHDRFWQLFPRTKTCARWADGVVNALLTHLRSVEPESAGDEAATRSGDGAGAPR